MKLTFEQIKSVTVGAAQIFEEGGAVYFHKFTAQQLRVIENTKRNNLISASVTTTGIRLDFHSNTAKFAFKSRVENAKFEVLVNEQPIYLDRHTPQNNTAEFDFNLIKYLCDCEKRITLILPSHSVGVLEWVEIDDGATFTPHQYDYKFLFFGDSLTQGYNSANDSLSYAYRVSRYFNAESCILGVGGSYYIPELVDGNHPFKPDVIFVAYGTNDRDIFSNQETKINCKAFMDNVNAVYPNVPVIGISIPWGTNSEEIMAGGKATDIREVLLENFRSHGATAVDGLTLIPHDARYFHDTVHPTNEGFMHYALNLIPYVKKVLEKSK